MDHLNDFPFNSRPLYEQYCSMWSEQKHVARHYRDWMLNVIRTLKLGKDVDFVCIYSIRPESCGKKSVTFMLSAEAKSRVDAFVADPQSFYRNVITAKQRFADAFASGEFKCSTCGEILPLDAFGRGEKKEYSTIAYHCLRCRRIKKAIGRTASYTNLERSLNVCYWNVRMKSRKMGVTPGFDKSFLVELWHKQNGLCYYTNKPMNFKRIARDYRPKGSFAKNDPDVVSIDRIDSSVGYTPQNVVLCRWCVNSMKSDMPLDFFLRIVAEIHSHQFPP